jgi:hypothetical protein
MYFFATGHVTHPDLLGPYMEDEKHALAALRREGIVREAFTPVGGHGVISILEGASLDEIQVQMSRLPFVARGLLNFEYTEVTQL